MGESTNESIPPEAWSGKLRLHRGPWDALLAQAAASRERFELDGTALTQDEAVEAYRLVAPLCGRDPDPDKAERAAAVRRFSYISPRTGLRCFNPETIRDMLTAFEAEHAGGVAVQAPDSILAEPWERYLALRFLQRLVSEDLISFPNETIRGCIARAVRILAQERPVTRPRGRHNPAINDRRDLFIRCCIERLEGCGLPVTSGAGGSLAGALAEVLGVSESTIRKVWKEWRLREACVNAAMTDELRMRESLIRRPREYFAVDVRCADCGRAGRVPKFRARKGESRVCLSCLPLDGSLPPDYC